MESAIAASPSRFNAKALGIIFLAHLSGDFYQAFLSPMLPLIKASLGLSLTQVGFIVSTVTLTGYLSQPVMGLLADRLGPRMFMITGLVFSSVLIPLMAITPWYGLLVLLAGFGALGSSMYHPTAAALVAQFAGRRGGFSMSIFGLGGTMGFALGPLAATMYVGAYGLENLPFASLLGLLCIVAVVLLLPKHETPAGGQTSLADNIKKGLGKAWKPIAALWLIGALRSLADVAIRTFYPILHVEHSGSIVSMGLFLSLFVLGGSASALVCGDLADRKGYKPIFYASYALSTPFLLAFLYSSGWLIYPAAFVAGFILLATMFPSVALANQLAPHNRSLASSITLGFAVGAGGFLSPLVGQLAEFIGIKEALVLVSFIPLLCLFLIPAIPSKKALDSGE